jgi:hypothetical protein
MKIVQGTIKQAIQGDPFEEGLTHAEVTPADKLPPHFCHGYGGYCSVLLPGEGGRERCESMNCEHLPVKQELAA